MSSSTDHRWGMKEETTFGTPVTVDRFYPWLDVEPDWDNRLRYAQGLASGGGARTVLANRVVVPQGQGMVKVKAELESKQGGVLLRAGIGMSTVTAITGGSQQVFHRGLTTGYMPGHTIQVVDVTNPGADYVLTYAGCSAVKTTIEQPEDDIPTIEVEFDALSLSTATAAATASYVSSSALFDASQASAGLGGSFTAPTNTALATGPTAFADLRSFKLEIDHKLQTGGRVLGAARSRPLAGIPEYSWSGTAEFNSTTMQAAYIVGTSLPFQCTWTTAEVLGAGVSQLQMAIPVLKLTKGMPKIKPGEVVTAELDARVFNDGTNRDIYLVYRTLDTAL